MKVFQFATWGMSPTAVMQAGGGKVVKLSPEEVRLHWSIMFDAKLGMPYSSGQFKFMAYFSFDEADRLA